MGLPEEWFGITYDTASTSTLCAVAAARELAVPGAGEHGVDTSVGLRMYASQEAHSVVDKAAMILGVGRENIRKIPVDDEFRMNPDQLESAIVADLAQGLKPFCVVATVGTTSITSIDPVRAIAVICKKHGLWLHVDAAYGGAAAVLPEMRWIFDGAEGADSLCMNPHKWLMVPVDISALFTSRPDALKRAFTFVKPYLETAHDEDVVNMSDYGPQLGRRSRALKLWLVIRAYGVEGIRERLRRSIDLARDLEAWVNATPEFELMAPRHFGLVCLRAHPVGMDEEALARLNADLLAHVNRTGRVFISHSVVQGKYLLRVAIGNMWTDAKHVNAVKTALVEGLAVLNAQAQIN